MLGAPKKSPRTLRRGLNPIFLRSWRRQANYIAMQHIVIIYY